MRYTHRPLLAGLLLAALLAAPAGRPAQFRYGASPGAGYDYAQTQAVANGRGQRRPPSATPLTAGATRPYPITRTRSTAS